MCIRDSPKASFILVYGVSITRILDLVFLGYVGVNTFYLVSIASSLLVMAGTFFLTSFRKILVLSLTIWVYYGHHVVSNLLRGNVDTTLLSADQQISIPTLGFVAVSYTHLFPGKEAHWKVIPGGYGQ